jgi:hypothetical protein
MNGTWEAVVVSSCCGQFCCRRCSRSTAGAAGASKSSDWVASELLQLLLQQLDLLLQLRQVLRRDALEPAVALLHNVLGAAQVQVRSAHVVKGWIGVHQLVEHLKATVVPKQIVVVGLAVLGTLGRALLALVAWFVEVVRVRHQNERLDAHKQLQQRAGALGVPGLAAPGAQQ